MNMDSVSQQAPRVRQGKSNGALLLEFLGSMNLAITLLVAVAIASVVGTVLQQNQPYGDYLVKFGPFWFEVFRALGLYDVYTSAWFLIILTFLVVSTSVCLYRYTPQMWREMTRYRTHVREASLRALSHRYEWRLRDDETAEQALQTVLKNQGYRFRRQQDGELRVYGAMKGRANRLGYIFTHLAIVVICVGGLIDGNLPLKWRELSGNLQIETRNVPVSQIGEESRLPASNPAFRGSVTIPEGRAAGVVFLPLRDGYVVQELPFVVEVEDFRVEHYDTGQPKSFESDLVIHDPHLDEPLRQTIAVNHPLVHRGYAIYQASFGDGGSELQLQAWPLDERIGQSFSLTGNVFEDQPIEVSGEQRVLELGDFQVFNVRPDIEPGRRFRNIGPSFIYRLRRPTGEALEYENFMLPVQLEGAWYFLSGVRRTVAEEFRYLHIPADPRMELTRFMNYLAALRDPAAVSAAALDAAEQVLAELGATDTGLAPAVALTAEDMVRRLLSGGFDAVERHLNERLRETEVEPGKRDLMINFSRLVLERTLDRLYREVLAAEGVTAERLSEVDQRFYFDALNAISALPDYGTPLYLQLTGFQHVQATGLQITKAPGQNVVYFGSALLIAGVFLLFYVPHRRLWALVKKDADGSARLLLAGTSKRDPLGFDQEFERLGQELGQRLDGNGSLIQTTGKRHGDTG